MTGHDLPAAYGGSGWAPRPTALAEELGTLWGAWGMGSEVAPLEAVLMHAPGPEIEGLADADAALMLEELSPTAMRREHQALRALYEDAGIQVHLVEPAAPIPPNALFCRDLFFMTPEGAVLARPAGRMRAGEERLIQARLAALGVPILLSVRGHGTFEGADALWVDRQTVLLATGLRTNEAGADQVQGLLHSMGVEVVRVTLSYGSLHLLGVVNLAGPDLAIAWPWRVPHRAVEALRASGFRVCFLPDETEAAKGMALNFVPLGPYRIVMPAGCPQTRAFYESLGITCLEAKIDAIRQAAGGMGCLTGILKRKSL
jgi:N-dimethylarginine dimethylaminohydrolase